MRQLSRILRRHHWSTASICCISALLTAQHSDPSVEGGANNGVAPRVFGCGAIAPMESAPMVLNCYRERKCPVQLAQRWFPGLAISSAKI